MRFSWSVFVKKLSFSFFVLNSIEDKDSRFISGVQFHLMAPVSFPLRLQTWGAVVSCFWD